MKKYIEALKGISYWEWVKLQEGINSEFERQIDETKKNLRLTDSKNVERAICSMFGRRSIYRQHKKGERKDEG